MLTFCLHLFDYIFYLIKPFGRDESSITVLRLLNPDQTKPNEVLDGFSDVSSLVCWETAQNIVDEEVAGPNDASGQHLFENGSRLRSYILHEKVLSK